MVIEHTKPNVWNRFTRDMAIILISLILIACAIIPVIHDVTYDAESVAVTNTNPIGINLALVDLESTHDNRSVTVTLAGDDIVFTGDYSSTIGATDMVILISNTCSLVCKDGKLLYYDGNSVKSVDSITLTVIGNTVNSIAATYVYFPDADGIYATYFGYNYSLSDCVGVSTCCGTAVISNENDIEKSNVDGFTAEVQENITGIIGVNYNRGA